MQILFAGLFCLCVFVCMRVCVYMCVMFPFYKYSTRAATFKNSVKVAQHISRINPSWWMLLFITKVEMLHKQARETCRQILGFGMFWERSAGL